MGVYGGEKLERYLKNVTQRARQDQTLRVGFLENATYPNGTSVAYVAAVQNWGHVFDDGRVIPPRPFFTNMVKEHKGEWPSQIAALLKYNDFQTTVTLKQMGQVIKDELVKSIIDTNEPPLAQSTIDQKGFEKPLVDTGHMMSSASFDVVDDNGSSS